MSEAANTTGCLRQFVGKKVVGVLRGELPLNRPDLASGNVSLIFDDGSALTLSAGERNFVRFWLDYPQDVGRALDRKRRDLEVADSELRRVLALAGAPALSALDGDEGTA